MRTCYHGTPVGTYCVQCGRRDKPRAIELDYNHYIQHGSPDTCERCAKVRANADGKLKGEA